MNDHFIVCGAGETGRVVAHGLVEAGRACLAVDRDPAALQRLLQAVPGARTLVADALDPETFDRADLAGAAGIALVLPEDKDNLFLVLAARQTNRALRIVCRSREPLKNRKKMFAAGTDAVISPNFIGGLRMVSEMVRPHATAFLDLLLHAHDTDVHFEEIAIPAGSPLDRLPLSETGFSGALVVAHHPAGAAGYDYNPGPRTRVAAGDGLVLFGSRAAIDKAKLRVGDLVP